jgi:hypothetical protein
MKKALFTMFILAFAVVGALSLDKVETAEAGYCYTSGSYLNSCYGNNYYGNDYYGGYGNSYGYGYGNYGYNSYLPYSYNSYNSYYPSTYSYGSYYPSYSNYSSYPSYYGGGYTNSYGISRIYNTEVHTIDGVPTLIYCVRHGIAKGAILNKDLTTTPCFIVKGDDGRFAHGETLREAQEALTTKLMDDMPENERIALFLEAHKQDCAYSVKDLFEWHHRLTGSCLEGRKAFAKNHDIDMNGAMTIKEFIELTRNSYGGAVIQNMEKEWKNGRH